MAEIHFCRKILFFEVDSLLIQFGDYTCTFASFSVSVKYLNKLTPNMTYLPTIGGQGNIYL